MASHAIVSDALRPQLVSVDGRSYPLESARVTGRAEGGIATTTLHQCFANPHEEALEVIYTLPLPADGAVLGYTIRIGERVIRGEVQPREQADRAYREALYAGRTAGLLEQDRADTFHQRLGNLPPRTRVEVEIDVLQPLCFLAAIDGHTPQWEYRFPTVAGARYQGAPGRVADAGRLDVDRDAAGNIPTRVELEITIDDPSDSGLGIDSPSHEIALDADAAATRVRLARGERLDRDIVLRWNACAAGVGVRMVEGGGLDGDAGRYALITVVPPAAADTAFHRDLTVLIDAGGSMSGPPLELAKRVVADLIHSLEPGDRFELLAFANHVEKLTHGLLDASPRSTQHALEALGRLQASGGTEMMDAMVKALEPLREDAQRQIVLVTDGYIGFEGEVIGHIMRSLPVGARVHAVGIGSAPNRTLLHGVAAAGRGMELSAGDAITASEAASRLRAATVRPVLTDLAIGGTAMRAHAPERPRDVFAGQPMLVTLELDPSGGALEVVGRLAGNDEPWVWRTTVAAAGAEGLIRSHLPIGALHGREAIADLELQSAVQSGIDFDARIEARGMRHRIVSRRTSLVAIAEEPSVDPKAPRRRERLAVELPAGVSAEGAGLIGGPMMAMPGALHRMGMIGSEKMVGMAPRAFSKSLLSKLASKSKDSARSEYISILATVIRAEPDLIVVEFETPFEGFELPHRRVEVREAGNQAHAAEVVSDQSSPTGPHARGLMVRLALRLDGLKPWPRDVVVEVRLDDGGRPVAGSSTNRGVRLFMRVPPATRES
jgi:Ca-activated chloride channel family protein